MANQPPPPGVDFLDLLRAFPRAREQPHDAPRPAPPRIIVLDDEESGAGPLLDDNYTLQPPTSQEDRDALRDILPSGAASELTVSRALAGVSDEAPEPAIVEERRPEAPASASPSPDLTTGGTAAPYIQFPPLDGDDFGLGGYGLDTADPDLELFRELPSPSAAGLDFGPDVLPSGFFGPSQSQSRPPLPPMTPPGSQEVADRRRPAGKSFPPAGKSFPPTVQEADAGDSMEIDASNLVVQPAAEELDPVFFDPPPPPAQPPPPVQQPDVDELDYRVEPEVEEAKRRELAEAAKKLRVAEAVERKKRAATERNQRAALEAEEEAEAEARRARDELARYLAEANELMMAEEEADWVAQPPAQPQTPLAARRPPPVPLPSDDEAWRLPYVLDAFVRTLREHAEDLRRRWPGGPSALDAMVTGLAPIGAQSPFDAIAFLGGARRPLADDDAVFSAAFLAAFPPLPAYRGEGEPEVMNIRTVSDALGRLELTATTNYWAWRDAARLATAWMDRPDAVPNAREMRLLALVLDTVHVPLCYMKLLALRRAIETAGVIHTINSLYEQTHAELGRVWASSEANDLAALATPRAQLYLSDATLAEITADIDSVPPL